MNHAVLRPHVGLPTGVKVPLAIGLGTSLAGGLTFRALHRYALHLPPAALQRATPGPFLAFGAVGLGVAIADRSGLHLGGGRHAQSIQDAVIGAVVFGALTLASPAFHGTKQPLAVSLLVNLGLGAAMGSAVHLLTAPSRPG